MVYVNCLIIITLTLIFRKRLLNSSVLGVYWIIYLTVIYAGLTVVAIFGANFLIYSVPLSEHERIQAHSIGTIGAVGVLMGALMVDLVLRPYPHAISFWKSNRISERCNSKLLFALCAITTILMLTMILPLFKPLVSTVLSGDISLISEFRDRFSGRATYGLALLTYNIAPFLSICALTFSIITKKYRFYSYAFLGLTMVGLILNLHKLPILIFLLQLILLLAILRPGALKNLVIRKTYFVSFATLAILTFFTMMTTLYYVTEGSAWSESTSSNIYHSFELGFERIFIRNPPSYFYYAKWIPNEIDFLSFNHVYTVTQLLNLEYFPINKYFFSKVISGCTNCPEGNSIADSLSFFYSQYGYISLICFSLIQGAILATIDRIIQRAAYTVITLTLHLFMIRTAFYLTETHFYGAFLGFGGALFIILALLLNKQATPETK